MVTSDTVVAGRTLRAMGLTRLVAAVVTSGLVYSFRRRCPGRLSMIAYC